MPVGMDITGYTDPSASPTTGSDEMASDDELWAAYLVALHERTSEGDPPMPESALYASWLRALRFALFADGRCSYAEAARRAGISPGTMTAALSRSPALRERTEWALKQGRTSIEEAIRDGWGEIPADDPPAAIARLRSRYWLEQELAALRRGEAPSPELLAEWD